MCPAAEREAEKMNSIIRNASCRCGQLRITCTGEPIRVSVCHCRNCKARSGSAFSAQARFPADQVRTEGEAKLYQHAGGSGTLADFYFCKDCGSTLWFLNRPELDSYAVPIGNFEPGHDFEPQFSVYEDRQLPWVCILGEAIERYD